MIVRHSIYKANNKNTKKTVLLQSRINFFSAIGTPMFVSAERIAFLEYDSMTFPAEIGFLMRSPPLSYVSNIYRLAFSDAVWICAFVLCLLATIIIAVTFKIRATANEVDEHLQLSDFFLLATAYLCQMGAEKSAKKLSSKIAMVRKRMCFSSRFVYSLQKHVFKFFVHCS